MKVRIFALALVLSVSCLVFVGAQEVASDAQEVKTEQSDQTSVWKYFAAALSVGISCIAGGMAVEIGRASCRERV